MGSRQFHWSGILEAESRTRERVLGGLLALSMALCVVPATAAEVAVRVRDDGRVDVRAKATPLVSVLARLASQTGMEVTYQGPPPLRTVSLEVSGANQADAVLAVLEESGADYAVTTGPAGTRILRVVVAGTASDAGAAEPAEPASSALPVAPEPGPPESAAPEPSPPLLDAAAADRNPREDPPATDAQPGGSSSEGSGDTYSPLTGDFIPGTRANGQPTAWGVPPFVLPDPPGGASSADAGFSQAAPAPSR